MVMASSGILDGIGIDERLQQKVQELGDKAPDFLRKLKRAEDESAREIIIEVLSEGETTSKNIHKLMRKRVVPGLNEKTSLSYSEKETALFIYKISSELADKHHSNYEKYSKGSSPRDFEKAYEELVEVSRFIEIAEEMRAAYKIHDLSGCTLDHLRLIFDNLSDEAKNANSSEKAIQEIKKDENYLENLERMNKDNSKHLQEKMDKMSKIAYEMN